MSCSPCRPSRTPWSDTGPWLAPIWRRYTGVGVIAIGWASPCNLCALRYPGRLLRSGELILAEALRFVADQVDITPQHRREILVGLMPVALATMSVVTIATTLMDEVRRRRLIVPGPFIVDQLVSAAMALAERQVAHQLARALLPAQANELDALLTTKGSASISGLAWARQPPGAPGHRALTRLVEQRGMLSAIAIDPACADGIHPERLRKLAREGARFTAQHLRALSPLRRRATLVATVLDTITRLTDDTVALFDRALGRILRRAEVREQDILIRDSRSINDKVRLLARLGAVLIEARGRPAPICRKRSLPRSAGTSWRAASKRRSASRAQTSRTSQYLPYAPGRFCIALDRCSLNPSNSMPFRRPPRHCARLSSCARFTKAAAGNGRAAYRRAFFALLGVKPFWARTGPTGGFGRQLP